MDRRVTLLGLILKIGYLLHRHRLMGIRMDWLAVGLLLLVAVALSRIGEGAWVALPAALAVVGILLMLLSWRLDYLVFRPHTQVCRERAREQLEPDREVKVNATGLFAVHGQERYLVEQPAVYTTPRSREHIIMAKLEPTRLLLLGTSDPEAWGWWYQFIAPDTIQSLQAGHSLHGWRIRPAIKIVYWLEDERQRQQQVDTILSFDNPECRSLVWDDITHEQRKSDATL